MKITMTNNMTTFDKIPVNHIFSTGNYIYMKMNDFWCYEDCEDGDEMVCFNAVLLNSPERIQLTHFDINDGVVYYPNATLTL